MTRSRRREFLFLIGSLKKGGAERNLSLVASNLAAMGHDVEIAVFERIVEFPIHHNVKVTDLRIMKYRKGALRIFAMYLSVAFLVWKRRPFKAIAFTRLASQFLAATFFPRVIARYDIYPFYMKKRRWISSLILFNLPNVRSVVSPSAKLEEMLRGYFIAYRKLVVIPNPVAVKSNLDLFDLPTNRPFFLVSGRLSHQKGVDLVIKAYFESKIARNGFDLVIMGDGPEHERLKSLVDHLDLGKSVHFLGFVEKPFSVVVKAFALVLASYREGFPNVLVEALSLGVPVISSDCPTGPSEIVSPGVNGFLFPVGDHVSLSEKMDLITDGGIHKTLKEQSVPSVSHFDQSTIMGLWQQLLIGH